MTQVKLKQLGFSNREDAIRFLKKLWSEEGASCPICGNPLELLHKKAKKSNCDWQCKACDLTYKTISLLDEINDTMK